MFKYNSFSTVFALCTTYFLLHDRRNGNGGSIRALSFIFSKNNAIRNNNTDKYENDSRMKI